MVHSTILNNNNNYKALRMQPPHDPLQTLSGECSDRRPEHSTPHGTRKTSRPVSSSSLRGPISFLRLIDFVRPFPSVRFFLRLPVVVVCVYPRYLSFRADKQYCIVHRTILHGTPHSNLWYTVRFFSKYGTSNVRFSRAAHYRTASIYARYCIVYCNSTV
jgi:hypothetical protein